MDQKISVVLSAEDYETLVQIAQEEYRQPPMQAAYMLRNAIRYVRPTRDEDVPINNALLKRNISPSMREAILSALRLAGEPMTAHDIADKAYLSYTAVTKALVVLTAAGECQRISIPGTNGYEYTITQTRPQRTRADRDDDAGEGAM